MDETQHLPRVNPVDYYLSQNEDFLDLLSVALAADPERVKNTAQLSLVVWGRLCGDVPNGGFTQFFYNHQGDIGLEELIEMLNTLEVPRMGDLLKEAQAIYRRHEAEFQVENPWDGLFGSIPEFEPLNQEFCKSTKPANKALEGWTRKNIHLVAQGMGGESLAAKFTGTVEVRHPNGELARSLEVKNGKAHGTYREFFEDGSPRRASLYKNGALAEALWPTGQPKVRISKSDGVTIVECFYPSGALHKRTVQGKDGSPCEPIRLFHENGQLAEVLHMKGTRELGPWLRYFPDGSPRLEAEYLEGRKLVVHNAWDDEGRQVVENGTGVFHNDGLKIKTAVRAVEPSDYTSAWEVKNGVLDGKHWMYKNGVLWSEGNSPNGVQNGESLTYWDNGRVHHRTLWKDGEEAASESFPKYDRPVPAVLLTLEANEQLYAGWGHIPVDEYPTALNQEEIESRFEIPEFHRAVHERNLAGTLQSDYEDASSFDDRIGYHLNVDETGAVTGVDGSASGVYSRDHVGAYEPLLRELRFRPAMKRGQPIACRVMARVHHTFVEGP